MAGATDSEAHTPSLWEPTDYEVGTYMYGYCHALGLALHKLTGLPLYAIVTGPKYEWTVVHVMIGLDDDRYLDIGGARTLADIKAIAINDGEDVHDWSVISATPDFLKAVAKEGGLHRLIPHDRAAALKVARRIVATLNSHPSLDDALVVEPGTALSRSLRR